MLVARTNLPVWDFQKLASLVLFAHPLLACQLEYRMCFPGCVHFSLISDIIGL